MGLHFFSNIKYYFYSILKINFPITVHSSKILFLNIINSLLKKLFKKKYPFLTETTIDLKLFFLL